jgi:hypothetical protein
MQYTKPNVLATFNANEAVQLTGNAPHGKNNFQVQDNLTDSTIRSTTGAYPGDDE